jgi:hypothetical protein
MSFFSNTFGKECFVNNGLRKTSEIGFLKPVDANLDTEGLPQSATGQSTIFTGVNASKLLGYHLTAVPNKKLKNIIAEKSFLKVLKRKGLRVTSANAYSEEYFEKVNAGKMKHSATTLNILAAGIDFRLIDDLKLGNAVFMDMTNRILIKNYGYDVNEISVERASCNLAAIALSNDFTMYEYFLTDLYGHLRGSLEDIIRVLNHIDIFTGKLIQSIDLEKHAVIIISDHGNIEDISKKPHTRNPVPFIVFSKDKRVLDFFDKKVESVVDISDAVINYYSLNAE